MGDVVDGVGAGPWGSSGTREELEAYLARVNEEVAVRSDRLRKLETAWLELDSRLRASGTSSDSAGRFVASAYGKRKQDRGVLQQLERERDEAKKDFERAAERKALVETELKKLTIYE